MDSFLFDYLFGSGLGLIGFQFQFHSFGWKMNPKTPLIKYPYLFHTRWRQISCGGKLSWRWLIIKPQFIGNIAKPGKQIIPI